MVVEVRSNSESIVEWSKSVNVLENRYLVTAVGVSLDYVFVARCNFKDVFTILLCVLLLSKIIGVCL